MLFFSSFLGIILAMAMHAGAYTEHNLKTRVKFPNEAKPVNPLRAIDLASGLIRVEAFSTRCSL